MSTFYDATTINRSFINAPVGVVDEYWTNDGKTAFGGLVAGLGLRAIMEAVQKGPPLRSVQIVHHNALRPGEVKFEAGMAAKHRTLVTSEVRLVQGRQPCATVSAIFAEERPGGPEVIPEEAPPPVEPEAVEPFPYMEGIMPPFLPNFDMRWVEGDLPYAGSAKTTVGGWIRHAHYPGPEGPALVALLDAWAPPVLSLLAGHGTAYSLSWTVHFNTTGAPADAWYYIRSEVGWLAGGIATTTATLQDTTGQRVATMKQLMRVKGTAPD